MSGGGDPKNQKKTNCWKSPVCSSSAYFIHVGQILSDLCSELAFVQTRGKEVSVDPATEAVWAGRSQRPVTSLARHPLYARRRLAEGKMIRMQGSSRQQTPRWREGPVIRLCKDDFFFFFLEETSIRVPPLSRAPRAIQ